MGRNDARLGVDRIICSPKPYEPAQGIDLTGKPKIFFTLGRGARGKSTLLRYAAEATLAAGRPVIVADLDRTNATLASYFSDVIRPTEGDEASVVSWLESLLTHVMKHQTSAYIDLGGGDMTLRRLVSQVPDLVEMLEAAGVATVAVYMIGPQVDDLSPLAMMEGAGFQPKATALVLNEGLIEAPVSREQAFARITKHSVFRNAIARGATPVWMPRLLPAGEIEARRVFYGQAASGQIREGRKQTPLGPFDQARVRAWLRDMQTKFAGVQSWIP